MSSEAMHGMDPTGRFSSRVGDYARWRPTYPGGAIDVVFEGLGAPRGLVVADVGAGTGISARLLAGRGARVVAVEPNAAMRREGIEASRHQGIEGGGKAAGNGQQATGEAGEIEWMDGTAERTGLLDGSVDVVVCAQAFHWFRHAEALDEFVRVLRGARRVVLMWNDRDLRDAFTAAYSAFLRDVSKGHPAEKDFDPRAIVEAHGVFAPMRLVEVPHSQRLTEEGLIGRAMSASYVPREEAVVERVRGLFREFERGGEVEIRYVTRVYVGEGR